VQQQQRVISGKKKKNRPMPPYTKDVLKRYNQRVFTDNVRLTAEVKELKQALAATETKLVAEEQDSFDTRFEREEAINFSCYLLQCMYHDGFTGALKMFEEYGSERYDGRCTAPLITNDAEFEGVVAGGYTQWMESLTYSQPPSATQEDAEVCEKLD
jgi:regulator of replication initiation timing